ncbi:MAG: ribonuclease PH [Alphaproteobacteria bacterium]
MRASGRRPDEMRRVVLEPGAAKYAEGSCLASFGDTKVFCTATLENQVPPFLKATGKGWITAEYGMLPRATSERTRREAVVGRQGGRTQEIQRLIGRSLRAVTALELLGERQIVMDCDVLQADGGTRTAAVTGGFVALHQCVSFMLKAGMIASHAVKDHVAAVSCGIIGGVAMLDLDYEEDSSANTDANFVITGAGGLVEVQGTAEGAPFSEAELNELLRLARKGVEELVAAQKRALGK